MIVGRRKSSAGIVCSQAVQSGSARIPSPAGGSSGGQQQVYPLAALIANSLPTNTSLRLVTENDGSAPHHHPRQALTPISENTIG